MDQDSIIEFRITTALKAVHDALLTIPEYLPTFQDMRIIGSTYINKKTTSDVDVLVTDPMCVLDLEFDGWKYGGSKTTWDGLWGSWKKTVDGVQVNMLICSTKEYIDDWLTAADVCRFLEHQGFPLPKPIVVGIHKIIKDGTDAYVQECNRHYNWGPV